MAGNTISGAPIMPDQKGKCTICGYEKTFWQWGSEPINKGNVNVSKNGPFIEDYCPECHCNRVFQKI